MIHRRVSLQIIKSTGVLEDVFTEEEKNHEMVKDKDSKLNFLQKLLDFIEKVNYQIVS